MKSEREIFIISEVHPQHSGSLCNLQAMILQSKLGGAHCVKVQLYNPIKLQGNNDRLYSQISFNELESIKAYCDKIEIDLLTWLIVASGLKLDCLFIGSNPNALSFSNLIS